MQIGDKINKNATIQEHIAFSQALNDNGFSVEDKGEYYEVVESVPAEEISVVATWQDRIEAQVMYTALLTDSLLEEGEE